MFKFYYIKQIKVILTLLNFSKYAAWCAFFIFQGRAIQQGIVKNILLGQLLETLIWVILTKLLVMLSDILSQFFIGYFENKELNKQWIERFPGILFQDNESKSNLIYLMYFDHLPNLFQLQCNIVSNQCTMLNVFLMVTSLLLYTGFYYGLIALSAVFILSFVSKNICLKSMDLYHKEINENKANTLGWIHQYFRSYREISFNWQGQMDSWGHLTYGLLYQAKKKLIFSQLMRDILSQLLVEIPFLINTSIVIVAVYLSYLSISELFIWVGFSQFAINASNSFLENKVNKAKRNILVKKLEEIISCFKITKNQNPIMSIDNDKSIKNIEIRLQDNTVNHLSLSPSIYHIKGGNGSGKSTLLNVIIGYERLIKVDNHQNLQCLLKSISVENIRVIERDPEIFSSLNNFNNQILGPKKRQLVFWKKLLEEKMTGLLSNELIIELIHVFSVVESTFFKREQTHFSSGEKILISLMRALSSWNRRVSILVVDECTAFLDPQTKGLFLRCISELSDSIAVYLITHESISLEKRAKVILETLN